MNKVVFDLDRNNKQKEFFLDVMRAVQDKTPHRYFFFGGAIRGGKTSVSLVILHLLARTHKNLRLHVVRKTLPAIKQTTIPSFRKLVGDSEHIEGFYDGGLQVRYKNGSRLFFWAENYAQDKELNLFQGLETNVFMLEQLEELQKETFLKSVERVGSWYNGEDNKPTMPGIVIATFNPTIGWLKEEIYEGYKQGTLPPMYYYKQATPADNPFVTKDQWTGWKETLDDVSYKRFIEGDWDVVTSKNLFFHTFSRDKHTAPTKYDNRKDLWISFDFNVNPMTCLLIQDNGRINTRVLTDITVLKELRVLNTGVTEFLEHLKASLKEIGVIREDGTFSTKVYITGDPAGANRHGYSAGSTFYKLIKDSLKLRNDQFHVLQHAPLHEDSYVLCNSVVQHIPNLTIDVSCKYFIQDLLNVQFSDLASINKYHKGDDETLLGHLLDCFRYYLQVRFPNFVPSTMLSLPSNQDVNFRTI